jgi:hypothetical protein
LLAIATVSAQKYKNIIVKAGTNILDYFPASERYRYSEFRDGTVFLRNNIFTSVKLNYNILSGEMEFISPASDTVSIGDPKNIKYVIFEKDTFVYDGGYLELIYQSPDLNIALKDYVKFMGIEKHGAYGTTSSTTSITTYKSLLSEGEAYSLTQKEDINLKRTAEYYISTDGGINHMLMTKFQIKKLYPGHKKEINMFFKKEITGLTDPVYLEQTVTFIRSLK